MVKLKNVTVKEADWGLGKKGALVEEVETGDRICVGKLSA